MSTPFTPLEATIGGILIGMASALYLWGNGKVFGISTIAADLFKDRKAWRLITIIGLILGAYLAHLLFATPDQITTA